MQYIIKNTISHFSKFSFKFTKALQNTAKRLKKCSLLYCINSFSSKVFHFK